MTLKNRETVKVRDWYSIDDGSILLIDEVETHDSSRYWKADTYEKRQVDGLEPENFGKEFIRLKYAKQGYRGDGDIPKLDESACKKVSELYTAVYEKITKKDFFHGKYPAEKRLFDNLRNVGMIN